MLRWQSTASHPSSLKHCARTEEELHACGNKACFAGYFAISPEWREAGGRNTSAGEPWFQGRLGYQAIAEFLEIPVEVAKELVQGTPLVGGNWSSYYGKPLYHVNADDILVKLNQLLESNDA